MQHSLTFLFGKTLGTLLSAVPFRRVLAAVIQKRLTGAVARAVRVVSERVV